MLFVKMAWRNIWRNKRRTLITLFVMSFSCVCLLCFICIGTGYYGGSVKNLVKAGTGHVQIHKDQFFSVFTPQYCLEPTPDLFEYLEQEKDIIHHARRIKGLGLVSYTSKAQNVTVIGIQPKEEPKISVFHQKKKNNRQGPLIDGEYLQENDWMEGRPNNDPTKPYRYPGLLLGKKLADNFKIKVGTKIVVTLQSLGGKPIPRPFVIRGIYKTLLPGYDKETVIIHYKKAQQLFGFADERLARFGNRHLEDLKKENITEEMQNYLRKKTFLFSVPLNYKKEIDGGKIGNRLRKSFSDYEYQLSTEAIIKTLSPDKILVVDPRKKNKYAMFFDKEKINVYKCGLSDKFTVKQESSEKRWNIYDTTYDQHYYIKYGQKFLFNIDVKPFTMDLVFREELDKGTAGPDLQMIFSEHWFLLSPNAVIAKEKTGKNWTISDRENKLIFRLVALDKEIQVSQVQLQEGYLAEELRPQFQKNGHMLSSSLKIKEKSDQEWTIYDQEQKKEYHVLKLRNTLIVSENTLDFFLKKDYFSEVVIIAREYDEIELLAQRLREKLGKEYEVMTFNEIHKTELEFLAIDKFFLALSLLILFVITAIGIVITLLMATFERMREFGVMRAVGMGHSRLIMLIMLESFWMAFISCVVGGLITLPIYQFYLHKQGIDMSKFMDAASMWSISLDPTIYAQAEFLPMFLCFAFLMLLPVLVSLYPAVKATKVKVIDALTFV